MPVYNREKLVIPSIESVISQKFNNWEFIIVDDASTDNTIDTINKYTEKDERIKLIIQESNQERGAARNKGVEESNGKYICFLDSDDEFCDNHLDNFYKHIQEKNELNALFFSGLYRKNNNEIRKSIAPKYSNAKNKFGYILHYTFNPTRVCVKKEILDNLKFDTTIPGLEDLDLWLRIAIKYPIIQLEEFTNIYLEHEESYTSSDANRFFKELKNFKTIFAKNELKNVLPRNKKNRLLSMCHFHLARNFDNANENLNMYKSIINSFFLYPKGYNGKTNKILAVLFLYNLPFFGFIIKKLVKINK